MANVISLSTTVNTDDTATITDGTTYTDPARANVGVHFKVFKVNYLSEKTELTATADYDDPSAVSEWTFDIDEDGWYLAYFVAIPDYDPLESYDRYDAVQDTSTYAVYRSKSDGNTGQALSNTTYWEVISDPADLALNVDTATESANIDSTLYNDIIMNQVTAHRGDMAIEAAQEGANTVDEPTESQWNFTIADFSMEAALTAEIRQQYAAAERYIRRMDEIVGI